MNAELSIYTYTHTHAQNSWEGLTPFGILADEPPLPLSAGLPLRHLKTAGATRLQLSKPQSLLGGALLSSTKHVPRCRGASPYSLSTAPLWLRVC